MRYLIHPAIPCLLCALTALTGCTAGSQAFSSGEKFENAGNYEEAMYSYAEAFRKDPESGEYRVHFLKAREKAADKHYRKGIELANKGNYVAALEEFQGAYGLDPSQEIYKQKVETVTILKNAQLAFQEGLDLEKSNKLKEANLQFVQAVSLSPDNKEYQAALRRVSGMRKNKLEGFELNLKSTKPITLKFKDAKIKDVFNILTQLSGINFVFDEGVKDQPISIYMENGTFQQAMEILTNMHKLGKKVLNESTMIIYSRTPEKAKQYEDMELRTFHLSFLEAKKAINLVRGMIQVRKIQVNEDSNSLIVRDTKDVVDVVEKILDANDVPDPEVVLDVEVLELNDTNTENVGLLLSNYNVSMAAFAPDGTPVSSTLPTSATSTSTTGSTSSSTVISSLIRAFEINGYGAFVTAPSGTYNFAKTLSKGEVLSNPKVRIKNKEKSKFTVGTRVPITTTTTTNQTTSVNVQYVDVGVKVNAEPTIQLNNEVSIKLSLEVSSILSTETVGGSTSATSVVTIGTRNLETVLSLKDGETSVIGGLISRTKTNDKTKIFLLGDLPVIGPLLSNNNDSKAKTELVLAITPRLVRGITVPQVDLSAFMSGKEDEPSLVRPLGAFEEEPVFATDAGVSTKAGQPSQAADMERQAKTAANRERIAAEQGQQKTPSPAAVPSPAAGTAPPGSPNPETGSGDIAGRGLIQVVAPAGITVGQQFSIDAKVSMVQNLASAPFVLTYDPASVEFVSAAEGAFLKQDGKSTTFSATAGPDGGSVMVATARAEGIGGVSGGGTLATFVFKAKKQGQATFGLNSVSFSAADGAPVKMMSFVKPVDIR